jgi:hypothetical protein
MIRDGNIENVPISVEDVRTFYEIYGKPKEAVRGKTTKKKRAARVEFDLEAKEQRKF